MPKKSKAKTSATLKVHVGDRYEANAKRMTPAQIPAPNPTRIALGVFFGDFMAR